MEALSKLIEKTRFDVYYLVLDLITDRLQREGGYYIADARPQSSLRIRLIESVFNREREIFKEPDQLLLHTMTIGNGRDLFADFVGTCSLESEDRNLRDNLIDFFAFATRFSVRYAKLTDAYETRAMVAFWTEQYLLNYSIDLMYLIALYGGWHSLI